MQVDDKLLCQLCPPTGSATVHRCNKYNGTTVQRCNGCNDATRCNTVQHRETLYNSATMQHGVTEPSTLEKLLVALRFSFD